MRTFLPPEVQLLDAVMGVPSRCPVTPNPSLTLVLPTLRSPGACGDWRLHSALSVLCSTVSQLLHKPGVAQTASGELLQRTDVLQPIGRGTRRGAYPTVAASCGTRAAALRCAMTCKRRDDPAA